MKTKIIYISGSNAFEIADIRMAFEEVRKTMGLCQSTVLFGVPVDDEDTFEMMSADNITAQEISPKIPESTEFITEDLPEIEQLNPQESSVITPKVKKTKVKKEKIIKEILENITAADDAEITDINIIQKEPDTDDSVLPEPVQYEKIVPILSILGKKPAPEKDTVIHTEKIETIITEVSIQSENDDMGEIIFSETTSIKTVSDESLPEFKNDELPEIIEKKTLEQLFEQMSPLSEDISENYFTPEENPEIEIKLDTNDEILEKLAVEFSEKQDEMPQAAAPENNSKIGKLKNILPFKKARREDSGLMGDLFGWAGIAANDDDFAIPGFFTTGTAKK